MSENFDVFHDTMRAHFNDAGQHYLLASGPINPKAAPPSQLTLVAINIESRPDTCLTCCELPFSTSEELSGQHQPIAVDAGISLFSLPIPGSGRLRRH